MHGLVCRRSASALIALRPGRKVSTLQWQGCTEVLAYMSTNESTDILQLCGDSLDRLGIRWRFSRRNTISVARKDAVERLDQFVGPKY